MSKLTSVLGGEVYFGKEHPDLTDQIKGARIANIGVDFEVGAFKIDLEDGRVLSLFSLDGDQHDVALFNTQAHYDEKKAHFREQAQVIKQTRDSTSDSIKERKLDGLNVEFAEIKLDGSRPKIRDMREMPPEVLQKIITELLKVVSVKQDDTIQ